jgi:hypothetical protein
MESTVYELDPDGDVELILRNANAPFAVWDESEEPPVPFVSDLWGTLGPQFRRKTSEKAGKAKQAKPSFESLDRGHATEPEDVLAPEDDPVPEEEPIPNEEPASGTYDAVTADTNSLDSALEETPSIVLPLVEVRLQLSSKHLTLASTYFRKMFRGPWTESRTSSGLPYPRDASEWDSDAILILMNIIHGRVRSVPRSIELEMLAKIAVLVDYYDCHEVVELISECWIQKLSCNLPKEYCRDLILWLTVS